MVATCSLLSWTRGRRGGGVAHKADQQAYRRIACDTGVMAHGSWSPGSPWPAAACRAGREAARGLRGARRRPAGGLQSAPGGPPQSWGLQGTGAARSATAAPPCSAASEHGSRPLHALSNLQAEPQEPTQCGTELRDSLAACPPWLRVSWPPMQLDVQAFDRHHYCSCIRGPPAVAEVPHEVRGGARGLGHRRGRCGRKAAGVQPQDVLLRARHCRLEDGQHGLHGPGLDSIQRLPARCMITLL